MRKLPLLMTVSEGRSRGRALVSVVRDAIISSVSWEHVEVGSSCRDWEITQTCQDVQIQEVILNSLWGFTSMSSKKRPGSMAMVRSYSAALHPGMEDRKASLIAHAPSTASSKPGFLQIELLLIQPLLNRVSPSTDGQANRFKDTLIPYRFYSNTRDLGRGRTAYCCSNKSEKPVLGQSTT